MLQKLLLSALGFKCSACNYQFTPADMSVAQNQLKTGAMLCPKCQQVIVPKVLPERHELNKGNILPSPRLNLKTIGSTLSLAATHEIANFSVQRKSESSNNEGTTYSHRVDVVLKSGETTKLCNTLSMNESLYIERELENFLRLDDNKNLDMNAGY